MTWALLLKFWREGVIAALLVLASVQTVRLSHAKHDLMVVQDKLDLITLREKNAAVLSAKVGTGATQITKTADQAQSTAQAQIIYRTRTIYQEIPHVVTPQVDVGFPIPVGPLRLWNDQLRPRDLAAVPDAPGKPDDVASGVAWSALTPWGVETIAAAQSCQAELAGLQGWVKDQQENWKQP